MIQGKNSNKSLSEEKIKCINLFLRNEQMDYHSSQYATNEEELFKKKNIRNFRFSGFAFTLVLSWNIRDVLSFGLKSFIPQNIRKFFSVICFIIFFQARKFLSWNFLFLGLESSVYWNTRGPFSRNIAKSSFWGNIRNFIQKGFFIYLFLFFKLGLKSSPVSPVIHNLCSYVEFCTYLHVH